MNNILYINCTAKPQDRYGKVLREAGYRVHSGTWAELMPRMRNGTLSAQLVLAVCKILNAETGERLRTLTRAARSVPCVLVSEGMTVESYLRAQALGISEYLCEPVDDDELLRVVSALMQSFQQRKQSAAARSAGCC